MNTLTRQAFNALCKAYCEGYGVPSVQEQFSLAPSVQQKLQDKIVEQSTFLPKINVIPVLELQGQNILGCVTGPVSGRTEPTQVLTAKSVCRAMCLVWNRTSISCTK